MTDFENPAERVLPDTPRAADEWDSRAIDLPPEYPLKRERLFSRKVLIGWALFALVAYFGVQIAVTAIKSSFREAVRSGVVTSTPTADGVVIQTPNGTKISIGRDRRHPGVTITRTIDKPIPPPNPTMPAAGAPKAEGAASAAPEKAAPAAPQAIPPEIKKR
jgi:hypothetical protein